MRILSQNCEFWLRSFFFIHLCQGWFFSKHFNRYTIYIYMIDLVSAFIDVNTDTRKSADWKSLLSSKDNHLPWADINGYTLFLQKAINFQDEFWVESYSVLRLTGALHRVGVQALCHPPSPRSWALFLFPEVLFLFFWNFVPLSGVLLLYILWSFFLSSRVCFFFLFCVVFCFEYKNCIVTHTYSRLLLNLTLCTLLQ